MDLYPAIDLYDQKAVRLYRGDYAQMTVYSEDPVSVAREFAAAGARHIHLVDLEGAKTGSTANMRVIADIARNVDLFIEVGGGIRNMETVERYLSMGADRVILGTAAVTDPAFLQAALDRYGERIAVGVDLKDGNVAIRGWTERTALSARAFFTRLESMGVKTVICTDISRDGAMKGTNRGLYRELSREFGMDIIASGGVSSMEDVMALRDLGIRGAIIGKAWYIGAIDLAQAVREAKL